MTDFWSVFWLCVIIFVALSIAFGIFALIMTSYIVFTKTLKRTKEAGWGRDCSSDEPEQIEMYNEGVKWSEKFSSYKKDVHIVNENLNLYGEYYDFGFNRAVIVVPGRTEGLRYGYYFAKPYEEQGFNVLTIDQRAHGESDGLYNSAGAAEYKDLLKWVEFLHNEFKVESIIFHGICIGSCCSLNAIVDETCPDYVDGMVADGMFPTFYESYKNHMIELKRPVFPCLQLVELWMRHFTGQTMRIGPIHKIHKLDKPLLMLHGKKDAYSVPEKAKLLYAKCNSAKKEIVWFDEGTHSKLRYLDKEKYDGAVKEFLNKNFAKTPSQTTV